jgi:hypothetical protein
MENNVQINDCVEFKNDLHKKLYTKSGADNFNEYINYIKSMYSNEKNSDGNDKNNLTYITNK